ncbi:hypothetical protein Ciccas_013081 [Cichlidogyrus casuarinus]|uniref:Rap-GAP domain-containing protein n=1 Tax=Cichlidogyrus casuarinus TaxID=1844966 RepID=A0ABD2PM35_9PLAT
MSNFLNKLIADNLAQVEPSSDQLATFMKELLALDKIVAKATHTIYTYFVRKAQKSMEAICGNMNDFHSLPSIFKKLIFAFGALKDVNCHTGWTGNTDTSYREMSAQQSDSQEFYSVPDGIERIVYWSDTLNELALICPKEALNLRKKTWDKHLEGGEMALVWLQSWDDYKPNLGHEYFDCPLIVYVHPLANGLLRVAISRCTGRQFEAGPLVSGLVLSSHTLAQMLRQTAINSARRRRVQSDLYQSVQSRRLAKLKNIVQPSMQEAQPKQQQQQQTVLCNYFSSKLVQNCTCFFENARPTPSLIT